LFEVIDLFRSSWVFKLIDNVEEHSVLVRLLHDFSNFVVEISQERSSWMVNDVQEGFKTNTTFTNISVEKTDTNNDVREFTKLSNLFWSCQGHEWSKTSSWKYRFESSSYFSFNCAGNGWSQFNGTIVSNDMLLVFVQKIIEDLLVQKCDSFKIVTGSWFEGNDFINESVGLMTQVSNVLLSLNFLLDICRIISNLQLDCV